MSTQLSLPHSGLGELAFTFLWSGRGIGTLLSPCTAPGSASLVCCPSLCCGHTFCPCLERMPLTSSRCSSRTTLRKASLVHVPFAHSLAPLLCSPGLLSGLACGPEPTALPWPSQVVVFPHKVREHEPGCAALCERQVCTQASSLVTCRAGSRALFRGGAGAEGTEAGTLCPLRGQP